MNHAAIKNIKAIMSQVPFTQGSQGIEVIRNKINTICQQYNYTLPKIFTLLLDGVEANKTDNRQLAIQILEEALTLCREEDTVQRLQIKAMLGGIYSDHENYQRAYILYKDVLENAYLLDANYLALAYTNISDFYLCLEQYERAYPIAAYGASYAEKVGQFMTHSVCLLNMGYALSYRHGEHEQAILHCKDGLEIGRRNNSIRAEAIAISYIAQIMARHHQSYVNVAINKHFEHAEELFTQIHDVHNQTQNRVHHIAFLTKIGEQQQALSYALKLYETIRVEDNYKFFALLCQSMCELLRAPDQCDLLCEVQSRYIEASQHYLSKIRSRKFENLLNHIEQANHDNERLVLDKMQQHIGAVTEVGQSIATSEHIASTLPLIFEKICSIFPTNEFGIALYHQETDTLDYCYFYDHNGPVEGFMVDCNTQYSVGSYVVKNKRTVHLNRITEENLSAFVPKEGRLAKQCAQTRNDTPIQSLIITPIMLKNKVLGVLSIQHPLADQYLQYHCNLFEQLASFIAIALENHIQRNHLKAANQKLEILSVTDPLTGLFNRYQLDDIAPQLIDQARKANTHLAAAVIDVDYYKGFNDYYGHQQGDIALQLIANAMKKVFAQENDYLFRYGGDEFLLLTYDSSPADLSLRLHALQKSIREMAMLNPLSQCSEHLTLSIGAANLLWLTDVETGFETLFNLADQELYKVKKSGRNNISHASHSLCNLA